MLRGDRAGQETHDVDRVGHDVQTFRRDPVVIFEVVSEDLARRYQRCYPVGVVALDQRSGGEQHCRDIVPDLAPTSEGERTLPAMPAQLPGDVHLGVTRLAAVPTRGRATTAPRTGQLVHEVIQAEAVLGARRQEEASLVRELVPPATSPSPTADACCTTGPSPSDAILEHAQPGRCSNHCHRCVHSRDVSIHGHSCASNPVRSCVAAYGRPAEEKVPVLATRSSFGVQSI